MSWLPDGALALKSSLWRRGRAGGMIVSMTTSQVGTTGITSALGFVYWWVAAHRFSPHAIGFAAAALSAMQLFGAVSVLGLGTMLIRELPRHPRRQGSLIVTGLSTAGLAGGVLGLFGVFALPLISGNLSRLTASAGSVLLFAAGVSLTAIATVLDLVLLGMLRGTLQFGRNAAFAVVKLGILVAVGLRFRDTLGFAIVAAWVMGILVSLVLVAGVVWREHGPCLYSPRWALLRGWAGPALMHHALNLELSLANLAMPIVVASVLSPTASAYFYTALMMASFVFVVPFALTVSLYAVGASSPAAAPEKARLTLGLAVLAGILTNCALLLGAHPLLALYGPAYATHAAWSLRVLGLAVFPLIIKDHYVAIRRIEGRVAGPAVGMLIASAFEIAFAAIGGHLRGLPGISLGWVLALCLETPFMIGTVYNAARLQGAARRLCRLGQAFPGVLWTRLATLRARETNASD